MLALERKLQFALVEEKLAPGLKKGGTKAGKKKLPVVEAKGPHKGAKAKREPVRPARKRKLAKGRRRK